MSMRYPGGFIASTPVTAGYPSGVWTQAQAIPYQAQNVWTRDQYWPYTTLLLQGNGTNGAQNNTFLDSSSNNFTITRNGNTTQGSFTPYEANGYWSNYFDGNGDYLYAGQNNAFAFGTGDFTVEFFVYTTSATSQMVYDTIQPNISGGGGNRFFVYINSDQTVIAGNAVNPLTSTNRIQLGAWNHVAVVRSGSTRTIYINGVSGGSSSFTNDLTSNYATIGFDAATSGTIILNGYLSNLRVVKGAALYSGSTYTVPTAPLAAITNTSLLTCQSNRFIDNSTNAFAITRNGDASVQAFQPFPGATTYSGTVLGGSGYFDGSGDYLTAPNSTAYRPGASTDFTIEGWLWVDALPPSYYRILTSGTNTSAVTNFGVSLESGGAINLWTQADTTLRSSTTPIVVRQWNHFAVSRSGTGSNNLKIYVNGVSTNFTTNVALNNGQTALLAVGSDSPGTDGLFKGFLSDIRIVVGSAIYSGSTLTPPTAPLTAVTNTQLLLSTTNAGIFDSAVMNDLETVGNAQVSTSVVKYGTGSMAFDGSGDYLQLPSGNQIYNLSSGDWTVECWVYFNTFTTTTTPHLWTIGTNTDNRFSVYRESSGGKLSFVTANSGSYTFANGTTTVATGTWYHVAVVRNNGVSRLYVNGVQEASSTTAINSGTSVFVGFLGYGSAAADYLNGYIDDLRITKGVARYITSFTPPPARMPGQ